MWYHHCALSCQIVKPTSFALIAPFAVSCTSGYSNAWARVHGSCVQKRSLLAAFVAVKEWRELIAGTAADVDSVG